MVIQFNGYIRKVCILYLSVLYCLLAIKFSSTYFENEESESHPALDILHRLSNASNELGIGVSCFLVIYIFTQTQMYRSQIYNLQSYSSLIIFFNLFIFFQSKEDHQSLKVSAQILFINLIFPI